MQATIHDLHFNHTRQLSAKENPVTDEDLLLQYRETGDRELYAQLVYRYERELFSYLRRYLGNAEMAEDVFQTAFLQVHLKCEQFEAGRRFRPWLYTIFKQPPRFEAELAVVSVPGRPSFAEIG